MAAGIRCADHMTPLYPQKLALTSPTGGGRSVGIVRLRTKVTEFFYIYIYVTDKVKRRLVCHKRIKIQRNGYSYSIFYVLSGNWMFVFRTCEALNSDACICLVRSRSCLYFMCFKSGSFWCPHYVFMLQSNTVSLLVSLIQQTTPHFLRNMTSLNVHVICLKVL